MILVNPLNNYTNDIIQVVKFGKNYSNVFLVTQNTAGFIIRAAFVLNLYLNLYKNV